MIGKLTRANQHAENNILKFSIHYCFLKQKNYLIPKIHKIKMINSCTFAFVLVYLVDNNNK